MLRFLAILALTLAACHALTRLVSQLTAADRYWRRE